MTINGDGMLWSSDQVLESLYGSSCSGYYHDDRLDFYLLIGGYKNCTTDEETFNDIRFEAYSNPLL